MNAPNCEPTHRGLGGWTSFTLGFYVCLDFDPGQLGDLSQQQHRVIWMLWQYALFITPLLVATSFSDFVPLHLSHRIAAHRDEQCGKDNKK